MAHRVNVYDSLGKVVHVIEFSEPLAYLSGRVCRAESGVYVKGAGVPYRSHLALDPTGYDVVERSKVFYCGYAVKNHNFEGKEGIFQERFQPYFSDFIGSCGHKELNLISTSKEFERSAVRVLDCINYDVANRQFYFMLDYLNDKLGYLYGGEPQDLFDLMSYMINEGWNFPWDKSAIRDITVGGLVSDVADIFKSKELVHQIGTIYSVVYSLSRISRKTFVKFTDFMGISPIQDRHLPTLVIYLLEKAGINTDPVFGGELTEDYFYKHIIGNYLIQGRNCAHVEEPSRGDDVRQEYIRQFSQR